MFKKQPDAIPLWLNLKKEYIDDNFDQLLSYIIKSRGDGTRDSFYNTTVSLLNARIKDMLHEISNAPVYQETPAHDRIVFNIRLLSLALHTAIDINPENRTTDDIPDHIEIFIALLLELDMLHPKSSSGLVELAAKAMIHKSIISPGFTLQKIVDFQPEIFIYHIINYSRFGEVISHSRMLEGNGRAWLNAEGLMLTATGESANFEQSATLGRSLDTGCRSCLATMSADKLKLSDADNIVAMAEFLSDFNAMQRRPLKQSSVKRKLKFEAGDKTSVRITGTLPEPEGTLFVETDDPAYERLQGRIVFEKPTLAFYYTNCFYKYLAAGDRLPVTVIDPVKGLFSFEKEFIRFQVEDTRSQYGTDEPFYAKLQQTTERYFNWLNDRGVWIVTPADPNYRRGDIARLQVDMYCYGEFYGRINAHIVDNEEPEMEFIDHEVRSDCVKEFSESTPPVSTENSSGITPGSLNPTLLKLTGRFFYLHQWTLFSPAERFRFLANAMAMAVFLGDDLTQSYLSFTMSYLRALVRFAADESLGDITLDPDSRFADSEPVRLRMAIVDILREYGNADYSPKLAKYITDNADNMPLASKLARMVQASNSIRGTLTPSADSVIKREIIRSLSIETEEKAELEAESRIYLGSEGQTVEFKTSIVFPPDNDMQPNQHLQTQNVFRAVCAFLNSMVGGTLYIGVDDFGYVTGLDADFRFLSCQTFDAYARYHIQDPLIHAFGLDVMTYIHIDSAYDDRVAVIRVEPHPYRVVELDNVAYLRVDRESREMPDKVRREMAMKKLTADNNRVAIILQLQHAEFKRKRAILKGYASIGCGTVADRLVEPYKVLPQHGIMLGFDCDAHESKVFSLSRIGHVEITDEPWRFPSSHIDFDVDAFHATGPKPIQVSLELDLMAKNLLVEEFPLTKNDISPCRGDDNLWYYNAELRSVEGLARFYLGLAPHIKITDAPELVEYLKNFVGRNLSSFIPR